MLFALIVLKSITEANGAQTEFLRTSNRKSFVPSPADYRARAAHYSDLAGKAENPIDAKNFRNHERSLLALASNEQWLIDHRTGVRVPGDEPKTTEDEKDASEGGRQPTQ